MSITALIFDLDGVIADTAELHYQSWKRLTDEEGIPFDRADNAHLRGLTRSASLRRILNGRTLDEASAQEWLARKNAYFLGSLDRLAPLPGAVRFLTEARQMGLKIGLASASRNAGIVLDKLDLLPMFDVVADGNTIVNSKPAPDVFLWVAGALNTPPQQALVFEDSAAGVSAAHAGGFRVVGVGTAGVEAAHLVMENGLAQMTPGAVLAQIDSVR